MKTLIKKFGKTFMLMLYGLERILFPIRNRYIVFESNVGRNYSGNPKALYEEILKQGLDKQYKCIYILEDLSTPVPGNVKKVKRLRFLYFYYLAISKVWVSDSRFPEFIIKRKETKYIQTWHGTPLKKLALDLDSVHMNGESSLAVYKEKFKNNSSTWDYLISQNQYSSSIFRRCFSFSGIMLETGYPRNDILFCKNNKNDINSIKESLGIPLNKKVLLYAPTWRDDQFYGDNRYKFNMDMDYGLLKKELENEYVLAVKCHYLIQDRVDWSKYSGFVYSFSSECDIAGLYLISDMLITDYSSVMFDYSLLQRPMLFYAYDLEAYKNQLRGFYFNYMEEIPGPVSKTTRELVRDIKEYKKEKYDAKYRKFMKKYNSFDDGKASEKVVSVIKKLMK